MVTIRFYISFLLVSIQEHFIGWLRLYWKALKNKYKLTKDSYMIFERLILYLLFESLLCESKIVLHISKQIKLPNNPQVTI
jgi:hypothetical protein